MSVTAHPFHILDVSQHPITASLGAMGVFTGLVLMMHGIVLGGVSSLIGGVLLVTVAAI